MSDDIVKEAEVVQELIVQIESTKAGPIEKSFVESIDVPDVSVKEIDNQQNFRKQIFRCPYEKCVCHEDCGIIEITGKTPVSAETCSYFRTLSQADKTKRRLERKIENNRRRRGH